MSTCPNCWQPSLETEAISHGIAQQYCHFCGETQETEVQPAFDVISPDAWSDEIEPAFSSLA